MKKKNVFSVRRMAIIGILGAISIVLGMTPLGFIPVGPTNATIMHVPVIIGAILEGPFVGGFIGLIFGLFSIFKAATNPTVVSFVFLNPVVSILPRVLIGIITYYIYAGINKLGTKNTNILLYLLWTGMVSYLSYGIYRNISGNQDFWVLMMNIILIIIILIFAYFTATKLNRSLDLIISTIMGTLTNTLGVLTLIYLFYGERFVAAMGLDPNNVFKIILGIGITNGIPEIIVAIIIVVSVISVLRPKRIENSKVEKDINRSKDSKNPRELN